MQAKKLKIFTQLFPMLKLKVFTKHKILNYAKNDNKKLSKMVAFMQ